MHPHTTPALAAGGAVVTLAAVPIAIGATEYSRAADDANIWSNVWFDLGIGLAALGAAVLLVAIVLWARREQTSHAAPPPSPRRTGIVNKVGGTARVYRPTYGRDLDVHVENEGDIEEHDPRH